MISFCDAFISYGRADSLAFGIKLSDRLRKEGFKVWFDKDHIKAAEDFQQKINDGIEKAHNFLFIISPHSVNSIYCRREIELALKLNKRIIPLFHVKEISKETWKQRNPNDTDEAWEAYTKQGSHHTELNPKMHPTIGGLHRIEFQEEIDDFEKSLASLIKVLHSHKDYIEKHTHFLLKALEWKRNHKKTSCLLIAEEKQQAEDWLMKPFGNKQQTCKPTDLHCEYITESIKNANNLMTQVFIAYADKDRADMKKIRNSLRRERITVWSKETDIRPGETTEQAINRGLEQADNVVYLLSPDSVNLNSCQRELKLAVSLHKRIIPVKVCKTSPNQVPSELRDLRYIDLSDNVEADDYKLDESQESQLLKILHEDATYYNEHKVVLTKALKWEQQHNNSTILLRGHDLESAKTWLKMAQQRTQHPPILLQEKFIEESLRQPHLESLDVFISYSRADSDLARKLNDNLQMQGKTTWFDQESIASGADFEQEIYRGIKACDNFLFILSPRSVNSPYCEKEVEYAASLNKRFVTVLHQEVNTKDLHPELSKKQWIDFREHERDFNDRFNQLVRTLDDDREHVHSHTKWLQRALEWNEKDKTADLLLRGSEFAIAEDWLKEAEQRNKRPAATPLQKEFIEVSKNAIEAAEAEEKRRQAEMLRLQEDLINALSRSSFILNDAGQQFDALIEAIRVGRQLQKRVNWSNPVAPATTIQALTALQAAVYGQGFREQNRLAEHTNSVSSVAFSSDGKTIASASYDNTVKLWSLDGKVQKILAEHKDRVFSVAFSSDGQMIASASADQTVNLWSVDGKLLHPLKHEAEVFSVAFSPDGQMIASASADRTVNLWSVDGKLLHRLPQNAQSISVAFSPDGKTIASGCWDNTVKLWSVDGELLHTLKGHTHKVSSVAFSRDGKMIASASYDKTVKLWSLEGQLLHTLTAHSLFVNSVAFSPDGKTIASASYDKTIKLWSLEGQPLQTLKGNTASVSSVAFSPDGEMLASASQDKTVNLWSLKGKELQTLKDHADAILGIAFSPDGKMLASASLDTNVKLWNTQGELLNTLPQGAPVTSVAFSPDGQMIASASLDTNVKLWNTQGELLNTLPQGAPGRSVAFSPDGQMLASATEYKTVKLWSMEGKLLCTLPQNDRVRNVAFSPDSQIIALSSFDKTVKLISLEGELLQTLKGHTAGVSSVAFSPNGNTIASASLDNTIKLWNVNGQLLHTLDHNDPVYSIAFSPDGKTIASASSNNAIKLWSIEGQLQQTLIANTSEFLSLAFSPDSKMLASGTADKTVILWNLADLTLDKLMASGCDWLQDYFKNNSPESDRTLCDGISHK